MALTKKQKDFAANTALGMTASDAARAAGYANSSPGALRVTASRLQHHPDVQQAAFAEREKRLHGPMASKALACLESVLDDAAAPPAARVAAAKFILEAAGHGIENRRLLSRHPDDSNKAISNMTLGELEQLVTHAEAKLKVAEGMVIEAGTDALTDTDEGEG